MAVDLRTYVFLDSLQLQNASFIATISKGYYPIGMQACCVIEISPGIEINRLTDIALKATNVHARPADRRARLRPSRSAFRQPGRRAHGR